MVDLQAEARHLALLQLVIDDEADADEEWDEAAGGTGEDFSLTHDEGDQAEEGDESEAKRDEHDRGAASIAERNAWGL